MKIKFTASAGTENKEDLIVRIEPSETFEISIESTVGKLFEKSIRESVTDELKKLGISSCKVMVRDFSALDYTVRSRAECAGRRALGETI